MSYHAAMAPLQEPLTERRHKNKSSATVRIPYYFADTPMAWFHSTFTVSRITEFHGALSKLLVMLMSQYITFAKK
jgi:hypothetical protein